MTGYVGGQSGRVAVVTGAGRGIGVMIAHRLAELGASVGVLDVDGDAAKQTARRLRDEFGVETLGVPADVTDHTITTRAVAAVHEGLGPVEVLVNNAGRWHYGAFVDTTPADWASDVAVNLTGVMNVCHAALPDMLERGYGRIVNIVSDSGRVGEPNVAAYAAAKAGVMGFSRALAKEIGRGGVTVNCVSLSTTLTPGAYETFTAEQLKKMTRRYPMDRLGRPEDAAAAVEYFASPAAEWVTGQTLSVNGGYAML